MVNKCCRFNVELGKKTPISFFYRGIKYIIKKKSDFMTFENIYDKDNNLCLKYEIKYIFI